MNSNGHPVLNNIAPCSIIDAASPSCCAARAGEAARGIAHQRNSALCGIEIPRVGQTPNWDFQVFTCVDRERHRLWKVQHDLPFAMRRSFSLSYFRTVTHADHGFAERHEVHLPVGLFVDLWRFNPDVIISGELGARTLIAALYSRMRDARFWFASRVRRTRSAI